MSSHPSTTPTGSSDSSDSSGPSTPSVSVPSPTSPTAHDGPGPLLTAHAALVLLSAVVVGLVVGVLSRLSGTPVPGAVLTGLLAAGGGVPVLRSLIGR